MCIWVPTSNRSDTLMAPTNVCHCNLTSERTGHNSKREAKEVHDSSNKCLCNSKKDKGKSKVFLKII